MHVCYPNTPEVEAGGSEVQDHPQLHSHLEASLGYMRPCLKRGEWKHGDILAFGRLGQAHHSNLGFKDSTVLGNVDLFSEIKHPNQHLSQGGEIGDMKIRDMGFVSKEDSAVPFAAQYWTPPDPSLALCAHNESSLSRPPTAQSWHLMDVCTWGQSRIRQNQPWLSI